MKLSTIIASVTAASCLAVGSGWAQSPAMQPGTDGGMMGRHSMEGQVTSVDTKKGWVHVKTAEGTMTLHFPPAALQEVKKGDRITVELSMKDNGPAASKTK
jgi:hypothetical protein